MLEYLTGLVARLGSWGYVAVFGVASMESAVFLGLFVPGETMAVAAGFMAAQHVLDLDAVIIVMAAGAALGDSIGYELGRRLGRPWAERHGGRFGVTEGRLKKGEAFFRRHGGKAVFLGRFVHFARVLVPFLAGSSRLSYPTFVSYNVLGASAWASLTVLLGYFLGQLSEKWLGRASAILGGIVLFALALAWAWHWLAGHETEVKARWERIRQRPRVAAALKRFAPQLAWLRRRLSPASYFGLELTSAVLVFVGAAWLLGGVTEDVLSGDPLTVVDRRIEAWFSAHQQHLVTSFMSAVSWLHTWPIGVAAALFLLYLLYSRLWRWAVISLLVVPGGMLLNTAMKLAVHRERPTLSGLSAALGSYSFPSGHAIAATLIYGLAAIYLVSRTRRWDRRVSIGLSAIFIVALVALSRMYLGVHYLSDVLAAMAEGVAWLAICHAVVTTWWMRASDDRRSCR
ncbi:MAG TPA: bifunctional DedA family/phosphatase PAP2 family protein [Burkholderiales bacterium]|nr:bifunctional DedA family/phosphatase PAP2 family protein [Burkholderiales bacterium]